MNQETIKSVVGAVAGVLIVGEVLTFVILLIKL